MTAPIVTTFNVGGTYTPTASGSAFVQVWAPGAPGADGATAGGNGGHGGAYSEGVVDVVVGVGETINLTGNAYFRNAQTLMAQSGSNGGLASGSVGTRKFSGGAGGVHSVFSGGDGGGSGTPTADGAAASQNNGGGSAGVNGSVGSTPGGGGGGGGSGADGGAGGPGRIVVTFNPTPVHYALTLAVRDSIRTLCTGNYLPGILAANVIERKVPYVADFGATAQYGFPGIVVCYGINETLQGGTNERDDIGYPVLVSIVDADPTLEAKQNQQIFWREVLLQQFRNQYLTLTNPDVKFHECTTEPGPIIDWTRWGSAGGLVVSSFVLRFWTRRARGN